MSNMFNMYSVDGLCLWPVGFRHQRTYAAPYIGKCWQVFLSLVLETNTPSASPRTLSSGKHVDVLSGIQLILCVVCSGRTYLLGESTVGVHDFTTPTRMPL